MACAPNATAEVFIQSGAADTGQRTAIGTVTTDASGQFNHTVSSSGLAIGPHSIIVECGAEQGEALVFSVNVIAAESSPFWMQPIFMGAVLVVALAAIALVLLRNKGDKEEEAEEPLVAPAPAAPRVSEDADDGAEYWVWDHLSEAGPRKRVACLTELGFYLHEIEGDDFPALLETVQNVGPDQALATAAFRFPVAEIREAARRGNLLRIILQNGQAQVIDLGGEAEDVFAMLRRRLGDNVCTEISVPANA